MKIIARLLATTVVAASFALAAPPAAACDTPPKCASCYLNPDFSLQDPRSIECYN
ncbi:MAG TPA: hypothetical protein VNA20_16485 [Frankiaceae bacterium]|nr:hypothetical protein [Frankiaceae bacterium]